MIVVHGNDGRWIVNIQSDGDFLHFHHSFEVIVASAQNGVNKVVYFGVDNVWIKVYDCIKLWEGAMTMQLYFYEMSDKSGMPMRWQARGLHCHTLLGFESL